MLDVTRENDLQLRLFKPLCSSQSYLLILKFSRGLKLKRRKFVLTNGGPNIDIKDFFLMLSKKDGNRMIINRADRRREAGPCACRREIGSRFFQLTSNSVISIFTHQYYKCNTAEKVHSAYQHSKRRTDSFVKFVSP